MRPLMINAKIQANIDAACARARQHPVRLTEEDMKILPTAKMGEPTTPLHQKDRPATWDPKRMARENVLIPVGYRAAITYEYQPEPLGLCAHLSISVHQRGELPGQMAVRAIAEAFGLFKEGYPRQGWLEEFDPGHYAVCLVEPVEWKSS